MRHQYSHSSLDSKGDQLIESQNRSHTIEPTVSAALVETTPEKADTTQKTNND